MSQSEEQLLQTYFSRLCKAREIASLEKFEEESQARLIESEIKEILSFINHSLYCLSADGKILEGLAPNVPSAIVSYWTLWKSKGAIG